MIRDEDDLSLNGNVGIAGMVAIEHTAVSFFFAHRRNEKILRDLDFNRP